MSIEKLKDYQLCIEQVGVTSHNGFDGVTLLYVIDGQITASYAEHHQQLTCDSLVILNPRTPYTLYGEQTNALIRFELTDELLTHFFPSHYRCHYQQPKQSSPFHQHHLTVLKVTAAKIALAQIKCSEHARLEIAHHLSELLLILTTHFAQEGLSQQRAKTRYSPRLLRLIEYIDNHYQQPLSLQGLAQQEHLSVAHLSRQFKNEVGVSFICYLNKRRLDATVFEILHSNKPLYRIIEEQGFRSNKQFSQLFRQRFNMTPSQFRQEKESKGTLPREEKSVRRAVCSKLDLNRVIHQLSNLIFLVHQNHTSLSAPSLSESTSQRITTRPPSSLTKMRYIITIGELSELLKADVRQQLLMLKQTAKVDYVDTYHLISGNMILPECATDEPIPTYLPYNNSDAAIAFLYQQNIALFVRIYHTNVVTESEHYIDKTIKFLTHCIHQYGYDYVSRWQFIYYFEARYLIDSPEFIASYLNIRKAITTLLPRAQFGLYYPFGKLEFIDNERLFQSALLTQTDFIGYSASFSEVFNPELLTAPPYTGESGYVQEKTLKIKQLLSQRQLAELPLVLLRWNTLTGNTRHTNGSFFRGALLFQTMAMLSQHIQQIGLSLNTEVQQETQPNQIDTRGIALFYLFNTKRPIFHVLTFIEKLRGQIIAQSESYLLTQTDTGYQLVLLNIAVFNPYLSLEKQLIRSYKQKRDITLQGIKSGYYQIRRYRFDQQNGALYQQYQQFQTRFGRNEEVFRYLEHRAMPHFSIYDEIIDEPCWQLNVELDMNAIYFYELQWMAPLEKTVG